jgi:hypothetical protein
MHKMGYSIRVHFVNILHYQKKTGWQAPLNASCTPKHRNGIIVQMAHMVNRE